MTTFTAIALDPGGTTGWAYYRATKITTYFIDDGDEDSEPLTEWYNEDWRVGQLGPNDHADDLALLLELNHTSEYHIICERFIPRPNKIGAKLEEAPRYITVAEMVAKERGVPFVLQNVGQVKPFVKNANIKSLGLWFPGQKHAMDAMRHLLFWLTTGPYKRVDLLEKGWK